MPMVHDTAQLTNEKYSILHHHVNSLEKCSLRLLWLSISLTHDRNLTVVPFDTLFQVQPVKTRTRGENHASFIHETRGKRFKPNEGAFVGMKAVLILLMKGWSLNSNFCYNQEHVRHTFCSIFWKTSSTSHSIFVLKLHVQIDMMLRELRPITCIAKKMKNAVTMENNTKVRDVTWK